MSYRHGTPADEVAAGPAHLIALRGVVLKGLAIPDLLAPLGALALFAAAVLGLCALRLSRR